MKSYARVKMACYMTNIAMSVVANISPVLFLTFRSLYDISYSLLGLLVLVNFFSQLIIDLIFSFFSHKFNIQRTVKLIPVLTLAGLFVYAMWPLLLPGSVYVGLVVGTLIFSVSGGLAEVLISPVIAAIPAKDPDREMSKLHSVYAWGVVGVVLFATVFLRIFGARSWHALALVFMLIPLVAALLYARCELPEMAAPERVGQVFAFLKDRDFGCVSPPSSLAVHRNVPWPSGAPDIWKRPWVCRSFGVIFSALLSSPSCLALGVPCMQAPAAASVAYCPSVRWVRWCAMVLLPCATSPLSVCLPVR